MRPSGDPVLESAWVALAVLGWLGFLVKTHPDVAKVEDAAASRHPRVKLW